MIQDSGSRTEFDSGAVRDIQAGKGRCDLLPLDVLANRRLLQKIDTMDALGRFQVSGDIQHLYEALTAFCQQRSWPVTTMILEVSKHFEEGANKYGPCNWQKGIPVHCYINSAVRHYLKWVRGDDDEPHDRAFVWNVLCCIWTIKHKPDLCDVPITAEKEA